MCRLKCEENNFGCKRSDNGNETILHFLKALRGRYGIILVFLASYFLLLTSHLLFAGGKVCWTPNGVLLNNFNAGVRSPIDDMKGGAIVLSASSPNPTVYFIHAIRVDRNGNLPWGVNGKKVDSSNVYQTLPAGVSDGKGGAILVWQRGMDPWSWLCYQRIDSVGNKVWGDTARWIALSDSQINPAIVSDGAGGAIVVWQQRRGVQGSDIYAQRIDSSGVRRWGDYGVAVCTADSSQAYPAITCDSSGNSVIVWWDARDGETDIYGQRLDISGIPFWGNNGIAICDNDSMQSNAGYGSIVVMATDTTIITVWHDMRNGNGDIYTQCLNVNGMPIWPIQGIPVCDTIGTKGGGQVISDGRGGAIFCWIDRRNGYWNLFAQRLNSNGQKLWANQGVPITTTDSAYWYQRIVSDGKSGAIICWQDKRSGNWDIYAQHIDSLGNILWEVNGMPVCTANNSQQYPEMIASDSGTAIICWADYRSGQVRGYAQKVGDDLVGTAETRGHGDRETERPVMVVYPNPFSDRVNIRYTIQDSRYKMLRIYDVSGRLIKSFNPVSGIGHYESELCWDGRDESNHELPSGIYFCELEVGGQRLTKKMILLR
ncbi:MAG: T9SS type A sorting domain-containing protein [candidate division WOR-3 bacterium]